MVEDKNKVELYEKEDEGLPPLLDDPESNSDDKDDGEESVLNDKTDNEIAFVTNDIIAIETANRSKQRFTKRDQLKATLVRRFQYVSGCLSDETIYI